MRFFKAPDLYSCDKSGRNQDKFVRAKSDKIGSRLPSKHLIVREEGRGGLREIKFDAGAIRPVPVGAADNQNGGKLMQSADLYRV